ncbi:hypothetical protein J8J14_14610 [Roseomonas sp. SSH11]|uniref:Uncharacterized protein n=1 Tax=Pararoseomonas baculiformis TaxID=2820812 RepID=A0ABS4AGK5_9PROT|nr:hypothetical protein [Pararoseomonas baculiformis]MBP0446006.1 hypothetical protein [Pararoseomonas baculiformis]
MNRPLIIAVMAALLGFAFWTWLTGPGTSVPNAFLALLCGILFGRAGWWIAARGMAEEDAPTPEAGPPPPPPRPIGRRSPPPVDAEPWRKPEGKE